MMLMLSLRPERRGDLVTPEVLRVDPTAPVHQYLDSYGNVCSRVTEPAGRVCFSSNFVINDSGEPDRLAPEAIQHPVEDLPDEALVFLLGSRYCETDYMADEAWSLFGGVAPGWARVQAIVDYAHQRISFGYHNARAPARRGRRTRNRWGSAATSPTWR